MIRPARTNAELAAYVSVWNEVWPDEPVSLDFVLDRVAREPERLYPLAERHERVVGPGLVGRSSTPRRCPVLIAVLPEWRRRGLGGALVDRCLTHARASRQ
jgi:GNAT superfamily N-acetyltransferase